MTILIPDARRGLLAGLVDDATLLDASAPDVERAVDGYRALRNGERGWMAGRLVVPASLLEEIAKVLVRTMVAGDSPLPIVAVFDGDTASDASKASAFHATMDPAARIEVVRLNAGAGDATGTAVEAANATRGIHHDVLAMLPVSPTADIGPSVATISAAKEATLQSVGTVLELPADATDAVSLAASIRACVAASTPFTVQAERFPGFTLIDQSNGRLAVGVMNTLAAVLETEATVTETAATLSDGERGAHTISFTGISRRGKSIRSGGSIGTDRYPLLSLSAFEPVSTIEALGGLDRSA